MPGFFMSHAMWVDHTAHEIPELQERRLGTVTRPDEIELQHNIQVLNGPQHHMRRKLLSAGRVDESVPQRSSKAAALPKGTIGGRGNRCQSYGHGHADPQW